MTATNMCSNFGGKWDSPPPPPPPPSLPWVIGNLMLQLHFTLLLLHYTLQRLPVTHAVETVWLLTVALLRPCAEHATKKDILLESVDLILNP